LKNWTRQYTAVSIFVLCCEARWFYVDEHVEDGKVRLQQQGALDVMGDCVASAYWKVAIDFDERWRCR